jgi:hypothetical protein
MNTTISLSFKKILFLMGIVLISWSTRAHAQSASDTTRHHNGMGFHRGPGGHEGFRHGQGFRDGQGFRGENGMAFHRHGRESIHYTPEQRKQVMAINKDYRQKSADLFQKDNSTLKEYKASLIALQKEKKSKLAALLTPQQKEEMAVRRKRMSENAQVMEVARLERLKLRLNLNDDQVSKIKAGQENLRGQFKAIHENDDLLPQQKMEQMKTLMAKRNDTYKSVLTPDQYSQFEKMGR